MKRWQADLAEQVFDVVVIGGGIYGAAITWQLTTAGLKTLLLDRGDFCGATSANSLKILHGGLRYLQHLDLKRMRESIRSRRDLMAACPHLVRPLGCLLPTSGYGLRSRLVMGTAFLFNDLISWDRNKGLGAENRLGRSRILDRQKLFAALPGLERREISGGALWHDGLACNTERLALEHILAARDQGAETINYMKVLRIVVQEGRVTGVEVEDGISGNRMVVRADRVVNAAGPWFESVLRASDIPVRQKTRWAKAVNLVVSKRLHPDYGIGLESREAYQDQNSIVKRGKRLYFFVPWRGGTMVGTTYCCFQEHPDRLRITEEDLNEIVEEVNSICPGMNLCLEDVTFFHCGLVPMADRQKMNSTGVQLAKSSLIIDHGKRDGPAGLISLRSIKYTTAPAVARRVAALLGYDAGGSGAWFSSPAAGVSLPAGGPNGDEVWSHLERKYGGRAGRILRFVTAGQGDPWLFRNPDVLRGEIQYFVREEMAMTLSDIIFRRSDLGTFACPAKALLDAIAEIMAREHGWHRERREQEVRSVQESYFPLPAAASCNGKKGGCR